MRLNQRASGFTLIETLITLIILGIVGISLFQVLRVSKGSVEDQKGMLETQQNARVALTAVADEFRHVSYGKDPTQPSIFYADQDSVAFVADIYPSPGAEIISYFLAGDANGDTPNPTDRILMKTVRDTSGTLLVSAPQSYGLADSSGLVLRYFNGNGVELASPVPAPETVGEIEITVTAVSPVEHRTGGYQSVTMSTRVYPRNLPLTASRSRPNRPGGGNITSPNCEALSISWTTPTSNTDGTPLPLEDISHFNVYIGTDPDNTSLHSRVARTINTWTVGGLTSGQIYYLQVSCVGTNGVESNRLNRSADLLVSYVPEAVAGLSAAATGGNAMLGWPPVTRFIDGSVITTPILYKVFRGSHPGFPLDASSQIAMVGPGTTSFTDAGLSNCVTYYYRVAAVACGGQGDASPEATVIDPAPPSCVTYAGAAQAGSPGEMVVFWGRPTTRTDGSALASGDIQNYFVYYDSIPGSYADSIQVPGSHTGVVITGLEECRMYYANVRAVDACGSPGDFCPGNQAAVLLGTPCTPGAPQSPTALVALGGDDRAELTWSPTPDCDLDGYQIWYGYHAGGPYSGMGATQGNSPITVPASAVTSGNQCRFTLTGLDACMSYYMVVTAYDRCGLASSSPPSNEVAVSTICQTCGIEPTCSPWFTLGSGNTSVLFSVHSTTEETVSELRPSWVASERLLEVWFGDRKVWSHDGSAGRDGAIGPVASGTRIHPDSFTISPETQAFDGAHMMLVYTGDMREMAIELGFIAGNGLCTVDGTPMRALLADDFNDRDITGWFPEGSGSWTAVQGFLEQLDPTPGEFFWISNGGVSFGNDFVYEVSMNMQSGYYGFMHFSRISDTNRHVSYVYGPGNTAYLAAFLPAFTSIAEGPFPFSMQDWHRMRVEKEGTIYRVYGDCELLIEASVFPEPPAGNFGVGEYYTDMRFDDILVVER